MKNDKLELHVIYDEFHKRNYRYLERMVGKSEADDLTQEVFIKVDTGLIDFEGVSKLSTWIYRNSGQELNL